MVAPNTWYKPLAQTSTRQLGSNNLTACHFLLAYPVTGIFLRNRSVTDATSDHAAKRVNCCSWALSNVNGSIENEAANLNGPESRVKHRHQISIKMEVNFEIQAACVGVSRLCLASNCKAASCRPWREVKHLACIMLHVRFQAL